VLPLAILAKTDNQPKKIVTLSPGETECDVQLIILYPIPNTIETINYDAFTTHPHLYADADSPLFPVKWHSLFVLELFVRLTEEFLGRQAPTSIQIRIQELLNTMYTRDNDADEWHNQTELEDRSGEVGGTNLPERYGQGYGSVD